MWANGWAVVSLSQSTRATCFIYQRYLRFCEATIITAVHLLAPELRVNDANSRQTRYSIPISLSLFVCPLAYFTWSAVYSWIIWLITSKWSKWCVCIKSEYKNKPHNPIRLLGTEHISRSFRSKSVHTIELICSMFTVKLFNIFVQFIRKISTDRMLTRNQTRFFFVRLLKKMSFFHT